MSLSGLHGSLLGTVLGCLPESDVCAARGVSRKWRSGRPLWRTIDATDTLVAMLPSVCVPGYVRSVNCAEQFTDAGLATVAATLVNLQWLNLTECGQVTDQGLVHVAALTSLEKLDLEGCMQITDAGLAHVAALVNLQRLDLTRCYKVTDVGLVHLAALPNLQWLELTFCEQLTGAWLAHAQKWTNLHHLSLFYCRQVTDAWLVHLAALTSLRDRVTWFHKAALEGNS